MGIAFNEITKEDLTDPNLTDLNALLRQFSQEINRLAGIHGTIALESDLNMQGHRITGLADPEDESDAVTNVFANSNFGSAATKKAMEATSKTTLQTFRRLNDRNQQERFTTFLNRTGAIPAQSNSSTITIVNNGDGTSTITVSAGRIMFGDGDRAAYAQRQDTVSNPGAGSEFRYYYVRLSDLTLQFIGPFTANLPENQHPASLDGRAFIGLAVVNAGGGGTGGGGGDTASQGGCAEVGTALEFPEGSAVKMNVKECGEFYELELDSGRKVVLAPDTLVTCFLRVQELQDGGYIEVGSGKIEKVKRVTRQVRTSHKMVVLVEPGGTYLANGVRVHNWKPNY